MSNKNTFIISNEHNRRIHYRQTSPPGNKVKSGIIERYTYKSDNGELLPSTAIETNINRSTPNSNISKCSTEANRNTRKALEIMRLQSNTLQTNKSLIRNKTSISSNKIDNLNTVRTEHCDSTTDVDVILKNKILSNIKQNNSDSDDSDEYSEINYRPVDIKSTLLNTQIQSEDSDSDCQIIDIKTPSSFKRKKFLKQMEWMIIADKKPVHSVQVISDSESENLDLQSNTLTSSLIPEKLKGSVVNQTNSVEVPMYMSDEDSLDNNRYENLEPSVYEISDGIQIVLPPNNSELVRSKKNYDSESPNAIDKPRFEILSNVILTPKQNESNNKRKSYESDDNHDVSSSEMHLRELRTPIFEKEKISKNTNFDSLNKSPKYDTTLSPESMKTEFYTYLKINTNPLAPKTETVMQNRRSVRVKNLIVQNEKLKEKIELKKQEEKVNDVRNKFLKYSHVKLQFPSFDEKNNSRMYFDDYIENYFIKEGIDYKNRERNQKIKSEAANKFNVRTLDVKNTSYNRKLLYKKIFIKPNDKKKVQKNKENLFVKRKIILKRKANLRRSNNSNRILRNRRVTRHSLTSTQQKIIRPPKAPIKIKNKKIKIPEKNNHKNTLETDKDLEIIKFQPKLTALDKLDLLTQSVISEYSTNQADYNSSPLPLRKYDNTQTDEESSHKNETEILSDDETLEQNRKQSPIESWLGFKPDETIHNIRKNMESALSTIIINPIIKINTPNENKSTETDSEKDTIENSSKSHASETSEISRNISEFEDNYHEYENKAIVTSEILNSETIKYDIQNYIPLNPNISKKSFHHSLLRTPKRKSTEAVSKSDPLYSINSLFSLSDTEENGNKSEGTKRNGTHEIDIQKSNGPVFNACYINCTLVIVQELLISFWKQTPLGNVLGAQNMWYSIGNIKRISLERGCINRRSTEMVFNVDSTVAYIELWTKEHQSEYREHPITDVFATVYFHNGQGLPDKKVLQLENIKGYGKDVRFAVMKNAREIVVSWYETFSMPAKAIVRSYQLANDFQTIYSTKEMESIEHFVHSLHNIGNCDTLVLGAGSDQISVWNLAHGWLSTTVSFEPTPLQIHSMCLWAFCETGYLFLLQQIGRGILRLVAINGVSSQWKQLQIFHVPDCYESLLGVTIESGILMTCYTNGFLCYDMQSGDLLADTETLNRVILPSDKFLVLLDNYKVSVKHVMVYVLEN